MPIGLFNVAVPDQRKRNICSIYNFLTTEVSEQVDHFSLFTFHFSLKKIASLTNFFLFSVYLE